MNKSWLDGWLADHEADLIALRRDLHAHPELGDDEHRTTALLVERLREAGLAPQILPTGTGLVCDVGSGRHTIALRADIDALPLQDTKTVPYRSTVDDMCHACGHDVHAVVLLGAGLALARSADLPGRIRLVFQPAEEQMTGGALRILETDLLQGVERIFALHCDPRLPVGQVGVRSGPITAAADRIIVYLSGPGGHTSRPQLTVDLVYALGKVVTELPGLLSRTVDPRSGMSMVWGAINAGVAYNAIPQTGSVGGTLRILDRESWHGAEKLIRRLVTEIVAPTGAVAEFDYARGVAPVVNDAASTAMFREGVQTGLGAAALTDTRQSMGGEDFGWYLETIPGALARLGVFGGGEPFDLHQGSFDVDERSIGVGVRALVHTALAAFAV